MTTLFLIGPGRHFGLELVQRFRRERFKTGIVTHRSAFDGIVDAHQLADAADAAALTAAIRNLANKLGPPTCLIYNARSPLSGDALSIDPAAFNEALAVNVTGALVAVQAALPLMQQNATVILTGGGYKDRPHPQKAPLSVGKAALHALAQCLQPVLAERGITLKTIVIDGHVRRDDPTALDPLQLAELYWDVYAGRDGMTHHFP